MEAEESLLDMSDELQAAQAQLTEMSTVLRQTPIDRHNSKVSIADYQKALMQAASLNIVSADKEKQLTDIVNETKRKALEMDQLLQIGPVLLNWACKTQPGLHTTAMIFMEALSGVEPQNVSLKVSHGLFTPHLLVIEGNKRPLCGEATRH